MNDLGQLFWRSLRDFGAGLIERLPYLIVAIVVLSLFLLISRLAVRGAVVAGHRAGLDPSLPVLIGRIGSFALTVVGLLIAATIVFPTFRAGDLMAGLGISSVAIGFALKDILQNFFAGLLLLWKKPFGIGDEIEIAGFIGTVETIDTRSTLIRTYSGQRAVLPNGMVYASSMLIKTAYAARRIERKVRVAYGSDLDRARTVAEEALRNTEHVLLEPVPQALVSELERTAVEITLYFWISPRGTNSNEVTALVLTRVKGALQAAGFDFAAENSVMLVSEDADG